MFWIDRVFITNAEGADRVGVVAATLGLHMLDAAMPLLRMDVAFAFGHSGTTREAGGERHGYTRF